MLPPFAPSYFFVSELKHCFLLQQTSSGSPAWLHFQQKIITWSIKTSSTVWAAWSQIKSSRFARRCNSTWCLVNRVGAGGGRWVVSKEIGGSVRLPVWRPVSRQWLSKWLRILGFLRFFGFYGSYCHRKLDFKTFLEWNIRWCNEF